MGRGAIGWKAKEGEMRILSRLPVRSKVDDADAHSLLEAMGKAEARLPALPGRWFKC